MNCHNIRVERPLPGRLPLFPEPYPGESVYSIFCRYHVRSGNINDGHTIRQLFGYNSRMLSTLLTPFHLEMTEYWMPESPNICAESMLRDNTAFTVYALSAFPHEIARMRKITAQRAHHMHSRLANPAGRLRFCPECAAEQKKIYGEPYWQVLFQLDEVEYCPIHRIRLRNTPISYKNIRNHFYPASLILNSQSFTSCETRTAWDNLFNKERDFFIKLAQNTAWILQNGMKYEGFHNLCVSYTKFLETKRGDPDLFFIERKGIEKALAPFSHNNMLLKYIKEKNAPNTHFFEFVLINDLTLCSHILLMTALCDHPKHFIVNRQKDFGYGRPMV